MSSLRHDNAIQQSMRDYCRINIICRADRVLDFLISLRKGRVAKLRLSWTRPTMERDCFGRAYIQNFIFRAKIQNKRLISSWLETCDSLIQFKEAACVHTSAKLLSLVCSCFHWGLQNGENVFQRWFRTGILTASCVRWGVREY